MRHPAVAGMFYPGSERELTRELKDCFRTGPGRSTPEKGKRVMGLVSPHAGYAYSGPTAAFGFLAMADGGLPDSVIIIGPNHHGLGEPIGISFEDFSTPLGVMRNDRELAEAIGIPPDELSHVSEHSMEVQLPFIQFFDKGIGQVCISMMDQSPQTARWLGDRIARALRTTERDAVIVASSDFTHCGRNYGYPVPGTMDPGEFARSRDIPVIEKLLKFDIEGALSEKRKLGTTACGLGPISAMFEAAKALGGGEARLLHYTTSYDVSPASSAVGYASIAVY
ncbi:MAG: AmmeMemoRadiSam system protein B [Candidatus Thermoplasmatota archaeon]|nr:AmmeMemoRadiSam system protein B [Candidatus Thermoplasmatota archaeon]